MAKGSGIVGSADFINRVKRRFMKDDLPVREQPAMRELKKEFIPDELIKHFSEITKAQNVLQRGKQSTERVMLMELLYRLCRITQPEIGKLLGGIDYSAVSQARKRFQQKLLKDQKLNEKFNSIQKKLCKMSRVKI
jgi:chromosomal replication initiation ATPase DnaA